VSSLSASDPVVSVQDVSITYRTTFEKRPTLKNALVSIGRREKTVREINAVRDVSFDVPQGTVLGIIGNNGAGKSTLVRAIAGILPPTSGRIEVRGRVSTLLALGVGFNANLTGQENVILGGLAAGYSREEIEDRYQEISDFAELGDFMEAPMRTYSSGMFSRLAFSVAVHMDPDILLVDEALSAGDAHFKQKATRKMTELVESARTMFLVSHALATVRSMCNDAIWINQGRLVLRGTPTEVVAAYQKYVEVGDEAMALEDL
jgi:lipopolysaccharide transport system ATP-binding protein/teichoic acid transport system ATP-binding protein